MRNSVRWALPVSIVAWGLSSVASFARGADDPAQGDRQASTQGKQDTSDELQEVLVTATRRGAESVQRVPIAMSVVSPADLDNKGLAAFMDFANTLPSVNVISASAGENDIEMRGLVTEGANDTNAQDRALVAVYLDDAPISLQAYNPDIKVYDLERVEVLRGPQGTLFGAGSMAGAIRFITVKPDTKDYSGNGDASVSATHNGGTNYNVRGMLNVPVIDGTLGVRLTVYRGYDSGYINNVQLDQTGVNSDYSTQWRLAVRWQPAEQFVLDASSTQLELHGGRNLVYAGLGQYNYSTLTTEQFWESFKLSNITGDFDAGFAHLISSTSYLGRQIAARSDDSYFIEANLTPGTLLPSYGTNTNDIHQLTEELRLVSKQDGPLRWTLGGFYNRASRFYPEDNPTLSPEFDEIIGENFFGNPNFNSQTAYGTPEPDDAFFGTINIKERELALFGDATYSITPKLNATLGARYFNFSDDFSLFFTGIGGALAPGEPLTESADQKSTGVNPRAAFSYQLADPVMLYAEAARGFRYGGVNEPVPPVYCSGQLAAIGLTAAPVTFGPDHVWSYTLGEKGTYLDNRLLFNADFFYVNWGDAQTTHNLTCGYYFDQNAGKVVSKGIEWESNLRVTHGLTVGVSGSFTDATAAQTIENVGAVEGDRVPYFPRTIVSITGAYSYQLPVGSIKLAVDDTYRGSSYTAFDPTQPDTLKIPSMTMFNASLTYNLRHWSISAYGTNLTNNGLIESKSPNIFAPALGDVLTIGRPRTIGVHITGRF
jgi:iron complex outermembrane recepter protein